MYKIKVPSKISSDLLVDYPETKKERILEMLNNFSAKMYEKECFELTEISGLKNIQYMDADETELYIQGYVITPKEYEAIIKILHLIKSVLPVQMRHYASRLHTLLTEEPSD